MTSEVFTKSESDFPGYCLRCRGKIASDSFERNAGYCPICHAREFQAALRKARRVDIARRMSASLTGIGTAVFGGIL